MANNLMEINIEEKPVAVAEINLKRLKKKLSNGVYKAIKYSFVVRKNEYFNSEKDMFTVIYAELDWGLIFKLMNKLPKEELLKLEIYRCKYFNMPFLIKNSLDIANKELSFKMKKKAGEEFIILGKGLVNNLDFWTDVFLSNRYYDPINYDWGVVDLNNIQ